MALCHLKQCQQVASGVHRAARVARAVDNNGRHRVVKETLQIIQVYLPVPVGLEGGKGEGQ